MMTKIYPRTGDKQTVYLNAVIKDPQIAVGNYTIYNDFVADPLLFEKNNVLYHYPIHRERLIIGKFCSIACGTKFLFNCANHTLKSLSTYTFPLFYEEWELEKSNITTAWDNKGDIIIYERYEKEELEIGEIIVFKTENVFVIHRIIDKKSVGEEIRYYTKGDANQQEDKGFRTQKNIVGIVKGKIPYIGKITLLLNDIINK